MTQSDAETRIGPGRGIRIAYWLATAAILFIMGAGGVYDMMNPPEVRDLMKHLGYPEYFPVWLGLAKILGCAAMLQGRFPRLREWAYAGFTFDLVAASIAHAEIGDPLFGVVFPLAFLIPLFVSHSLVDRVRGRASSL